MDRRGRTLRLTAMAALVVLALTGFSSGRGHGSSTRGGSDGGGGGGGGGGCSSSSQDHDTSSSSSGSYSSGSSGYDDDDDGYDDDGYDYGLGGSGGLSSESTGPTVRPAAGKLVSCATKARPYATVEVTNPNDIAYDFDVAVLFMLANDVAIEEVRVTVKVPAHGKKSVQMKFGGGEPGEVLDHCEIGTPILPSDD